MPGSIPGCHPFRLDRIVTSLCSWCAMGRPRTSPSIFVHGKRRSSVHACVHACTFPRRHPSDRSFHLDTSMRRRHVCDGSERVYLTSTTDADTCACVVSMRIPRRRLPTCRYFLGSSTGFLFLLRSLPDLCPHRTTPLVLPGSPLPPSPYTKAHNHNSDRHTAHPNAQITVVAWVVDASHPRMAGRKHNARSKEGSGRMDTRMTRTERRTKVERTLPRNTPHEDGKTERTTRRKPRDDQESDAFVRTLQRMRCSLFENYPILNAVDPKTWDRCAKVCLEQKSSLVSIKARVIRNLWEALQYEVEIFLRLKLHPNGSTGRSPLGSFIRSLERAWDGKYMVATNLSWQEVLGISKTDVKQCLPLVRCFLKREKALVRAQLATIDICSSRSRPNEDVQMNSFEDCTVAWNFRDNKCTQLDHSHTGNYC